MAWNGGFPQVVYESCISCPWPYSERRLSFYAFPLGQFYFLLLIFCYDIFTSGPTLWSLVWRCADDPESIFISRARYDVSWLGTICVYFILLLRPCQFSRTCIGSIIGFAFVVVVSRAIRPCAHWLMHEHVGVCCVSWQAIVHTSLISREVWPHVKHTMYLLLY